MKRSDEKKPIPMFSLILRKHPVRDRRGVKREDMTWDGPDLPRPDHGENMTGAEEEMERAAPLSRFLIDLFRVV